MEYRALGRTGMRVSVLGLGCGGFGGIGSASELFGKGEDKQTAFALMNHAWDAGINYFDTADSYGGGASERMIGGWLRERKVRDRLILSTKVLYALGEGSGEIRVEQSIHSVGGGQAVFVPDGDTHCYVNTGAAPLVVVGAMAPPIQLDDIHPAMPPLALSGVGRAAGEASRVATTIMDERLVTPTLM